MLNRVRGFVALAVIVTLCVAGCPPIEEERLLTVEVQTTLGNFTLVLDETNAPASTDRFQDLVEADFYDGTILHQVVAGEFIQGGVFDAEFISEPVAIGLINESSNGRLNQRGTVAFFFTDLTAESEATTQFLINLSDNPEFDPTVVSPGFAVFADVLEGLDILDQIGAVETTASNGFASVPVEAVVVNDMIVQRVSTGQVVAAPETEAYFEAVADNFPNAVRSIVVDLLGAFITFGF